MALLNWRTEPSTAARDLSYAGDELESRLAFASSGAKNLPGLRMIYGISHTHQQLAEIREHLTDAIVFGSVNRYSSYPHFLLALHLKMVDLRDASILWALEEVWDSSDKSTQQRIQQYFANQMKTGYEPLNWKILETSPRYFNKFVVYEVARTLPDYPSYESPSLSSENVRIFNRIPQKLANLLK